MFNPLKNLFDFNAKRISSYKLILDKINQEEISLKDLSDKKLKQVSSDLKKLAQSGTSLDDILPKAYALVRLAIQKTIGEHAYDVQLMSAICLHQGSIAEQRTGEGKTHSVIFPAYLNSLTGKGVHIVTPNDYLTKVGTGWYTPALHFLGVSVAGIIHEQSFIYDPSYSNQSEKFDSRLSHLKPIEKKDAYLADITYGTSNEFGFDYLRDHMISDESQRVQANHNYAIVDEVDFVLIDEARTPLIISSPGEQATNQYSQFAKIADNLQATDYIIDEKARSATLTEYGIRKVERILNVKNLYQESFQTIHQIENAIKAKALFTKDKDYVIADGQIIIVDEFTGRLMYGRRWSDGLHQAIEAKENVTVQRESKTWATITFQNYFRLYKKLAGMTGTAATESEEFKQIYNLDVLVIPTHKTIQRQDKNDLIFKTKRSKYAAVASQIEELYKKGQPVLIGTTSIENNQIVSTLLSKKKIPHNLLNAKNHQAEAQIISQAGKFGAVTVATNMAGRGVDIILGGSKEGQDQASWIDNHQKVIDVGGLYVIGTERHESRRVDNQLRGRAGRQGDPGNSQFYVSLEDDLMRIFGGDKISSLMTRFNMPEDAPLAHPLVSRALEQIQVKVEGYNFDMRKGIVEYDDVINKQREIVYSLRDSVISNSPKKPLKNKKLLFSYLRKQVKTIVLLSLTQGQLPDFKKMTLEFSEILPLNSKGRQNLADKLKQSKNPKKVLMSQLKTAWKDRQSIFSKSLLNQVLCHVFISTLDPLWVDHLTILDDLKDGVRLRAYAQKDPLIEFRKDGFVMFQNLLSSFEYNLSRRVFRIQRAQPQVQDQPVNLNEGRGDQVNLSSKEDSPLPDSSVKPKEKTVVKNQIQVGRNDPCPCSSGKKYKKCCYPKFG